MSGYVELVVRYDVASLTHDEQAALLLEAIVQAEASDDHPTVDVSAKFLKTSSRRRLFGLRRSRS